MQNKVTPLQSYRHYDCNVIFLRLRKKVLFVPYSTLLPRTHVFRLKLVALSIVFFQSFSVSDIPGTYKSVLDEEISLLLKLKERLKSNHPFQLVKLDHPARANKDQHSSDKSHEKLNATTSNEDNRNLFEGLTKNTHKMITKFNEEFNDKKDFKSLPGTNFNIEDKNSSYNAEMFTKFNPVPNFVLVNFTNSIVKKTNTPDQTKRQSDTHETDCDEIGAKTKTDALNDIVPVFVSRISEGIEENDEISVEDVTKLRMIKENIVVVNSNLGTKTGEKLKRKSIKNKNDKETISDKTETIVRKDKENLDINSEKDFISQNFEDISSNEFEDIASHNFEEIEKNKSSNDRNRSDATFETNISSTQIPGNVTIETMARQKRSTEIENYYMDQFMYLANYFNNTRHGKLSMKLSK